MASFVSTDFISKFMSMTQREKMIAIGQITGDEPSKDDQEFNFALTFVGKNAWKLVDRVLLDFKSKRADKYHKLYRDQLGVILANLHETYSIQDYLFTFYSRSNDDYKESKRYNPNELSVRPLKFLADSLEWNMFRINWLKLHPADLYKVYDIYQFFCS